MELLVATLVYTTPGRDADVLARIRLISDTVRNAPGLVTSGFYRSRGNESYYFILTTWEDEESWQQAQERHNPKKLLLGAAQSLLKAQPEQWLMRYLWGYSRPTAPPVLAGAYLATLRPDQIELTQRGWIKGLRHQAIQPTLAFAFLARGLREETLPPANSTLPNTPGAIDHPHHTGSVLLNFFSWASETEREQFLADPSYQAINQFVSSVGIVRILLLEPM